jgi:hypothetical protein
MSQKAAKSATELESMIMAELREHPECESAGVEVRPTGVAWDAVLIRLVHKLMTPARRGSRKSSVGFGRSSI